MVKGQEWTGFEAVALQEAMRQSVRDFAALLGVETTTVANWRSGLGAVRPRPLTQGMLDTQLQRADGQAVARFEQIVGEGETHWKGRRAVASRADRPAGEIVVGSQLVAPIDSSASLLSSLDATRLVVDQTLASCTVSSMHLDLLEERAAERILSYTMTSPAEMLRTLMPDLLEVQGIAAQRQPATIQSRLSEMSAVFGLLIADALMKLGEVTRANYWYDTARIAADDTPNLRLRARVRAQHAMLPYYYGRIEKTVTLAREAQALLPGVATDETALAAAAEARALARLGQFSDADEAMTRAQQLTESLTHPATDEAFRFHEKRLLLYLSGTLTYMGQTDRARRIQTEALELYRRSPEILIDPALIHLDAAVAHASDGLSMTPASLRPMS